MSAGTTQAPRAVAGADDEYTRESRQGYGVLAIFGGTFAFIAIVVALGSRAPHIELSAQQLAVSSSGYGKTIPVAEIQKVELVTQLTGIGDKRNAFQFGSQYRGSFDMKPYGAATLFIDATKPPYVIVHAKSGVMLFNAGDAARTRRLYDSLTALRPADHVP